MKCPICRSNQGKLVREINIEKLSLSYKKLLPNIPNKYFAREIQMIECNRCKIQYFDGATPGDEKFYKDLNDYEWYYQKEKYEYEFVSKFIDSNDKVLDIGCGEGAFSEYVKKRNGIFYGLELNKKAALRGVELERNISTTTIEDFTSKYGKVDVVCSFQVCEHISDLNSFISLKVEAVRKDGLLFIAVPSEESFISKSTNAIMNYPPHHMTRWNDQVFNSIAEIFHLDLIEIHHEPVSNQHKEWFLRVLIENTILKPKDFDSSIKRKVTSKISNLLSKLLKPLYNFKSDNYGHTVIAVFKKL